MPLPLLLSVLSLLSMAPSPPPSLTSPSQSLPSPRVLVSPPRLTSSVFGFVSFFLLWSNCLWLFVENLCFSQERASYW
ncbi:hypothetical protein SLEP1_g8344 [Rubroshorea leprosula]|uniref:Secreted protein n=2 Tax=Rubroshorea leprosula TaxID=152421 RepID=A0AAV5I1F0_9ROSI|nr:hypothetical protein SLEP1_g8344 [Rubroshorea leprosula]